jgi:hypothetical protein
MRLQWLYDWKKINKNECFAVVGSHFKREQNPDDGQENMERQGLLVSLHTFLAVDRFYLCVWRVSNPRPYLCSFFLGYW